MNLLLDTHAFLWFVEENARLSSIARSAIENPRNQKWVSIASCWEISIKVGIGKLQLSDPVDVFLGRELVVNGFSLLPIELKHVTEVSRLALHHRDPFDRLLIAQSQVEGISLVSGDLAFDAYGLVRVW